MIRKHKSQTTFLASPGIKSVLAVLILLVVSITTPVEAVEVTIYTEEFPPYNYSEGEKLTGVSTKVVERVMKNSGFDYKIISYPWARSYLLSQKQPNSLIYSIARTPERDKLFKWVGLIVPTRTSVFCLAKRTDIRIHTLNDLKAYKMGTVINDGMEVHLLGKGFELSDFQRAGGDDAYLLNYLMLKRGRIDLMPAVDGVAHYLVKKAGDDPAGMLKKIFRLKDISGGGAYLAAGLTTSDELIQRLAQALEQFKTTQEYAVLLAEWGIDF